MLTVKFSHAHIDQVAPGLRPSDISGHVSRMFEQASCEGRAARQTWDGPLLRGVTICRLVDDGEEVARGYAFCSMRDQFCKRTGRLIAEGRARKALREATQSDMDALRLTPTSRGFMFGPFTNYGHAAEHDSPDSTMIGYPNSPTREDGTPK